MSRGKLAETAAGNLVQTQSSLHQRVNAVGFGERPLYPL